MQRFRDYLYCDKTKFNLFYNQIKEFECNKSMEVVNKETTIDAGVNVPFAKAGTAIKEMSSSSFDIQRSNLESFVNWTNNDENGIIYCGQELDNSIKDCIIVFTGRLEIPEMSENIEILNSILKNDMFNNYIDISEEDKKNISYINVSNNIPVILDCNENYLFNFNVKSQYLEEGKNEFYENIGDEVTVIGRINNIYNSEDPVEIYDLYKEIFNLNRAIRRKIPADSLKDAIITENGPLIKVTPIIIYK